MTRKDHQIIFTALGFLAVIMRENSSRDKQAVRAADIAELIEAFCRAVLPDAFSDDQVFHNMSVPEDESLIERCLTALRTADLASADLDRSTLLRVYELLTIQKMRHEQEPFYLLAQDDVIASNVLRLAEERIERKHKTG